MEHCGECAFRYDAVPPGQIGAAVVGGADEIAGLLAEPEAGRRRRPEVWSPLEYGCHVRDMLLAQRERVLLARREDAPLAVPMGRDVRVEHDGYAAQAPADVARQLRDAARLFANVLARLPEDQWQRTVVYTYPEPATRTLVWVAAHTLHEVRHHRLDIERQK